MDMRGQDLRYAGRRLIASPRFTLIATFHLPSDAFAPGLGGPNAMSRRQNPSSESVFMKALGWSPFQRWTFRFIRSRTRRSHSRPCC
jgi:hypothetical protein